ncbi:MAG: 50S ribosomal protein L17 [Saprospiraceae bacterium]|nr:50S ribosomal protein L17 [Saprospiraceae bacterium]MBK8484586.1 50S ribosomal protein L17 [Saprospiraceae bacterium]MBK9222013.1 50S ribosomal protein L17 [Saprospiraceae bacterium]MBK9721077.1 50S ribosomal protein L17 [Saprospiraceae bacterium]MBK9728068.1 50S ribosomal protein L17 [Saprospiraceae bacterium]
MRHGKAFNHLSRKKGHRMALLRNLASALITHKRITTTLAKAKALRVYIEPLMTKAKSNTTHSRRTVFSYLQNKDSITELFSAVAAKIAERPGGYTRIIRTGFRKGDGAEMAMIEMVDFNEIMVSASKSAAPTAVVKKTRRGGGKLKKTDTPNEERSGANENPASVQE